MLHFAVMTEYKTPPSCSDFSAGILSQLPINGILGNWQVSASIRPRQLSAACEPCECSASPRYARPALPLTRMRYHSSTVGVIIGWDSGALGVSTGRNRESECGGEEKVTR